MATPVHARPLALIVRVVCRFSSEIVLCAGDAKVNARHILEVACWVDEAQNLNAFEVKVVATGNDEEDIHTDKSTGYIKVIKVI